MLLKKKKTVTINAQITKYNIGQIKLLSCIVNITIL